MQTLKKRISDLQPRPRWRGFSFALHPTRCRAFILSRCNTASYKRLQRVLCRQCNYTAHVIKRRTVLYSGFSCDCTRSITHDTRPTKAAIIQTCGTLERVQEPQRLQHIPDTTATPGRCTGQHSPPIIIRYIRGGRPCQPGGVSMLPTPGGLQSGTLHPVGQSSSRGGGRSGTIGGSRRISFRAVAR